MVAQKILVFILIGCSFLPILTLKDRSLRRLFLCTVLLYQILALLLSTRYSVQLLQYLPDIAEFNHRALEIIQTHHWHYAIDANFYADMLAGLYILAGFSLYFGAQLSIIAFAWSFIYLLKLFNLLGINQTIQKIAFLLYVLAPPSLLFCSTEMREPFEVLFLMMGIYYSLLALQAKKQYVIYGILFLFVGGLFHQGLLLYNITLSLILSMIVLFKDFQPKPVRKKIILIGIFIIISTLLVGGCAYLSRNTISGTDLEHNLFNGHLIQYIQRFYARMSNSRTSYLNIIRQYSEGNVILSLVLSYVLYLFTPLAWQISNVADLIAFGVVVERLLFLFIIILTWFKYKMFRKLNVIILLFIFFTMSFCWAIMTTNYGTAIRHNMLTDWILLLLAAHAVSVWFSKKDYKRISVS